jgi:hypothetical protein
MKDISGKIYQGIDARGHQEFCMIQVHGAGVQNASGWAAGALHAMFEAPPVPVSVRARRHSALRALRLPNNRMLRHYVHG